MRGTKKGMRGYLARGYNYLVGKY